MRIRSGKWLLALLLQSAAATGLPQTADSRASVAGRVSNSATGAPIVRAHVSLNGDRQKYGALTGVDGKFSIAHLPAGQYIITVDAPGFQSPPAFWDVPIDRVDLRPGERKDDLDLILIPLGAISGRVLDSRNRPLQGIALSALGIEGMIEGEMSDPDGRYRLGGLSPGSYCVLAAPRSVGNLAPEIRSDGTAEVHHAPTYYPASLAVESATRLVVAPGSERTGIDIRLVRTPIVAVKGNVLDIPSGVSEVSVVVHKIDPPRAPTDGLSNYGRRFADARRVNPDGSFVIWRLDPGSYLLSAQSYPDGWVSPPVEVKVAAENIRGIMPRLVPLSDISGRIVPDDIGAQLPAIPPNASLAETPQISLRGGTSNAWYSSVIASDGSFHLTRVLPERYHVYLSWGPYVKSMSLASSEIDGAMLDLRNGSQGTSLTVTASSAQGQISGVVRDASGPAAYARVALLSEKGGIEGNLAVLSARSDGTYNFPDITPGKFRLLALDAGVVHAGGLRYFLEEYADIIETVEIQSGDKLTLDLRRHIKRKKE